MGHGAKPPGSGGCGVQSRRIIHHGGPADGTAACPPALEAPRPARGSAADDRRLSRGVAPSCHGRRTAVDDRQLALPDRGQGRGPGYRLPVLARRRPDVPRTGRRPGIHHRRGHEPRRAVRDPRHRLVVHRALSRSRAPAPPARQCHHPGRPRVDPGVHRLPRDRRRGLERIATAGRRSALRLLFRGLRRHRDAGPAVRPDLGRDAARRPRHDPQPDARPDHARDRAGGASGRRIGSQPGPRGGLDGRLGRHGRDRPSPVHRQTRRLPVPARSRSTRLADLSWPAAFRTRRSTSRSDCPALSCRSS